MLRQGRGDESPLAEPDRPRKKLSFREPEIMGYYMQMKQNVTSRLSRKGRAPKKKDEPGGGVQQLTVQLKPQSPPPALIERRGSDEDDELESQAMRVVRTVGQAFDVCHKLSINSPEEEHSEKDSTLEKNKKVSDNFSDHLSFDEMGADESNSNLDVVSGMTSSPLPVQRPMRLDIMTPPQNNNHQRKSPMAGETYSSPLSEPLKPLDVSGSGLPSAGTPLGAHHELQLLREQLDQQTQQTQAAVAQVHLLRDQLAAETAARLEAQARIHQLLVHNKELLDHISSLVQHLQEQERLQGNQVTSVPQHMMCDMPTVGPMYLSDMTGSQYLHPQSLSGSYYNLGLVQQQPQMDFIQRLRAYYSPMSQGMFGTSGNRASGAASFPGTPVMPHRAPQTPPESRAEMKDDHFIRPLDADCDDQQTQPSHSSGAAARLSTDLNSLRLQDARPSFIQRSTSEKVPNRSELMSQVQRTAWARHTTK
ncbi:capon-like protein isoform X2 [Cimex lectularius]|uniref:Capon-like protein n=1 Tax=Cimex lectularius TaxID=79782 RepID=A0A8I6SC57_CIMLE|nr:capon-like protein isoform X2 [Cimex lectularius]